MNDQITSLAERLLEMQPDLAPQFHLLRDVMGLPVYDPLCKATRQDLMRSQHVLALAQAQLPDGTWGRFHSQDSKVKSPFRTSEFAIRRALSLGLTTEDPILSKASVFMEKFLQGKVEWSDWAEKHEGWEPNTRFITAGTFSEVDPFHPMLEPFHALWQKILQRAFHNGAYDPAAERDAQRELNGIVTKGKYLHLGMMYPLLILSSGHRPLPEELERSLLRWLWEREEGMYYVTPARMSDFPTVESPHFSSWLDGLMVLSRFPRAGRVIAPASKWIWEQQNPKGFWDFNPPAGGTPFFPLSENWRRPENKLIDCSVKVLLLLKKLTPNSSQSLR